MASQKVTLHRRLNLPLLTLYGVGVTVGAGIYVLIGAMAAHAGMKTPLAFIVAGFVMTFTAASYAELCTRLPYAAGEASYAKAAFRSRTLSTAVGLVTAFIGIISSAAVSLGSVGYIRELIELPVPFLLTVIVISLGGVAIFGILESVVLAAVFTIIEVTGLLLIVTAGFSGDIRLWAALPDLVIPPLGSVALTGIAFASLLAFFAFIGFEDLVNVVEEVQEPQKTVPRAIALTLIISILLYFFVAAYSVLAVSPERLAASSAPLSLVFREVAGVNPLAITLIAIVATLNTVLVQMTMASRVLYGMAKHGDLPEMFGDVYAPTRTPVVSTIIVILLVLFLALLSPLEILAEWTSLATLAIFATINLALLKLKLGRVEDSPPALKVPVWVPVLGLITCLGMFSFALL